MQLSATLWSSHPHYPAEVASTGSNHRGEGSELHLPSNPREEYAQKVQVDAYLAQSFILSQDKENECSSFGIFQNKVSTI